jgi:hypothetical protein
MKSAFLAFILLCLLVSYTNPAQANDLYHDPYEAGTGYQYLQPYDPYYNLHLIHYQLYRRQYQYQPYCHCVRGFTIGQWPRQIRPCPEGIRR